MGFKVPSWVIAAAIWAVSFGVLWLAGLFEQESDSELSTLSPPPEQIAMAAVFLIMLFLLTWTVVAVVRGLLRDRRRHAGLTRQ